MVCWSQFSSQWQMTQRGPQPVYQRNSVSFIGIYITGESISTHLQKQVLIVYQSREDKPDLPDEKARIEAAGGYVSIPPDDNGDVSRAYYVDEHRRLRYGLAMSRSLGDWKVQGVM